MLDTIFTTNENTTDGEILDRIYELIYRTDIPDDKKLHFITLSLEYAKETPQECPEHGGAFDCTPFCPTCYGEQEVTKK